MSAPSEPGPDWRERVRDVVYRGLVWGDRRVPLGIRSLLGVLFLCGGVLWFLPVLGIWMLPLGIAFIALDIPWSRRRVRDWMRAQQRRRRARRSRV